jgi:Ca2+-binding EF-hand superfamily protein
MSVSRNLLIATAVCSALLITGVAEAKRTTLKKGATACVAAPATTSGMGAMGGSLPMAGGPGGAPGSAEDALLKHFDAMDANHDGLLSKAEITAFFDNIRQQIEAKLRAADTNGDQQISREEAQAALPMVAAMFDFLDADHDGQLTKEELGRLLTPEGQEAIRLAIINRVKAADTNHDGMLDLAEVQTGLPGLAGKFSQIDKNGDGLLSPDELRGAF